LQHGDGRRVADITIVIIIIIIIIIIIVAGRAGVEQLNDMMI
jgi:hypothetical protein